MSGNWPKVTIAIPTYNQRESIKKTIGSALAQDYPNLEVLIADDCSPERVDDIIQQFGEDSRLKYFRNEENIGRTKNYRKSLYEYATGDWYLNLDGDDFFTDNSFISAAMQKISEMDSPVLFYQAKHFETEDPKASIPATSNKLEKITGKEFFESFPRRVDFSHMSTIFNRQLATKNNFYSAEALSTDIESLLSLSALEEGAVLLHDKIIGIWLKHSSNASTNSKENEQLENLNIYQDIFNRVTKSGNFEKKQLRKWKQELIARNAGFIMAQAIRIKPVLSSINFGLKILVKYPYVIFYKTFLKQSMFSLIGKK
jgi:glycosyltransferase involved in cell wall biosynthesis